MKIDLKSSKDEFLNYIQKYDLSNENIKRKQIHSLRVMQISENIARSLGLIEEEVNLAMLIGLLHDIARFEQYTQYQTFKDSISFDHGDYALKILEKDIRKYIDTNEFDDIIKKSIKNHNKLYIEQGLNKKEELFAKIIRDADKLDIFFEASEIFWNGQEKEVEESTISDEVFQAVKNNSQVIKSKEKNFTKLDFVITNIAIAFDINYDLSFEILYKKDYINKIANRFSIKDTATKEKFEEIRKIANNYIKQQLKEI